MEEDRKTHMEGTREKPIRLTTREGEVLRLIFEGLRSREVADLLFCSKRTVDFHLAQIYEKLGVSNRVQAMRRVDSLSLLDKLVLQAA